MKFASLQKIVEFADRELKTSSIKDYTEAFNGLQVENNGKVTRIVAAVDANEITIQKAIRAKADLLIVHHGLFWGHPLPLTGPAFRRIQLCIKNNLAVYSSHLPLDLHAKIGNNAILAKKIGFKNIKPFCEYKGNIIGRQGTLNLHRNALVQKLEKIVGGKIKLIPGGPERIRKIGVVSGGAGELEPAIEAKLDTYITGEGAHHTFAQAYENGINLIYAGHYATETFGVNALAEKLAKKFRIPFQFIDAPSGM